MTAPPGRAPVTCPTARPKTADAYMALMDFLARDARRQLAAAGQKVPSRREALRIAMQFAEARESDRRDAAAHAEAVAANGFADAAQVVRDEFRAWLRRGDIMRVPAKVTVTESRVGARGWAVTS